MEEESLSTGRTKPAGDDTVRGITFTEWFEGCGFIFNEDIFFSDDSTVFFCVLISFIIPNLFRFFYNHSGNLRRCKFVGINY